MIRVVGSYSRIAPQLYQGGRPPTGSKLNDEGFDVLVLAAREYQPRSRQFPRVRVLHAPLDDDSSRTLSERSRQTYQRAAIEVANAIMKGQRVLVTCQMGINRSGLISAAALRHLGHPARRSIHAVRKGRGIALTNRRFVEELHALDQKQISVMKDCRKGLQRCADCDHFTCTDNLKRRVR